MYAIMSSENIQNIIQPTPQTAYFNILMSINITILSTRLSLGADNGRRKLIFYYCQLPSTLYNFTILL